MQISKLQPFNNHLTSKGAYPSLIRVLISKPAIQIFVLADNGTAGFHEVACLWSIIILYYIIADSDQTIMGGGSGTYLGYSYPSKFPHLELSEL